LAFTLTAGNRHDITQLLALLDRVKPVRGSRGRPRKRPRQLIADRGYDSEGHRRELRRRGIKPQIARRKTEHGSGLGVYRWVIERTFSWLHQFRRLRIRYERDPTMHEAFMHLACATICWRRLNSI
jgi:transposase